MHLGTLSHAKTRAAKGAAGNALTTARENRVAERPVAPLFIKLGPISPKARILINSPE